MPKVVILVNDVLDSVDPSDLDVLTQSREVRESLERCGHEVVEVACSLDLAAARQELLRLAPDIVFNLVESLAGTDRLMAAAPLLLDALQLSYTGSGTQAILHSGDKLQAKTAMAAAGIETPAWFDCQSQAWQNSGNSGWAAPPSTVITKANYEHASFAMAGSAVFEYENQTQIEQVLDERLQSTGQLHLAEEFITGREFNLSLLEIDGRPQVMAPAEIDFSGLPAHLPQIVGASAKWDVASIECQQTPRRFDFPASDATLMSEVSQLAIRCWHLFQLRGYARVDFRVGAKQRPYVLEVNANPCLSRDAGFVAAAEQSGISYDQVICRIISAAGSRTRLNFAPNNRK